MGREGGKKGGKTRGRGGERARGQTQIDRNDRPCPGDRGDIVLAGNASLLVAPISWAHLIKIDQDGAIGNTAVEKMLPAWYHTIDDCK